MHCTDATYLWIAVFVNGSDIQYAHKLHFLQTSFCIHMEHLIQLF